MTNLLRTQISLTKEQKARLDELSAVKNVSISHIVRNAINQYVREHQSIHSKRVEDIAALAGSWKETHWDGVDPEKYQKDLRQEE